MEDRRMFYVFPIVKAIREDLKQNHSPLANNDYGAPAKSMSGTRTIADIAKHTAIGPRIGQYLFKIIHTYKPEIMLELGTAVGISTIYQAAAALGGDLISIEGNPALVQVAEAEITQLGLPNISLINGKFSEVLPELLDELPQVDYVFLDGHHDKAARLEYFEMLLPKLTENSILVFSDIYWSKGMQEAWEILIKHPKVRLSIDLFDIGILFFNPAILERQNFKLVPIRWKPWRLGLFRFYS
ncbi:MAG: class I SAM-dependent methyltransferase [Saprospiraceae bacterium]